MPSSNIQKTKIKDVADSISTTVSIPILFPDSKEKELPLVVQKKRKNPSFSSFEAIYIPKDIFVDSNDEEYIETVKNLYQKALKNYESIHQNMKFISPDRRIYSTLDELSLVALNILLIFAEKPHKLINHSRFIEYYQERAARFTEQYVKLTYHVQNQDLSAIETLEGIFENLKGVFYVEYKRLSEADMSDLTAELKVMEQNLKDYDNALKEALGDKPSLKTNISSAHIDADYRKPDIPSGSIEAAIANFIEALKGVMIGGVVFSMVFVVVVFVIIMIYLLN